jgi:hypothetical protein
MSLGVDMILSTLSGCTTYRIIRYRQPDARNQGMFPKRVVRKADTPFQFARASTLRTDLDTVTVRAPDGKRISFQKYMADYAVLAFVVIQRDLGFAETERGEDGHGFVGRHLSGCRPAKVASAEALKPIPKLLLALIRGIALSRTIGRRRRPRFRHC